MSLPIPEKEQKRLAALHQYQILDTPPEESFDRLSQLAAIACNTPIAIISLIDENRHWFKAKVGVDITENRPQLSFCQHTLNAGSYTEIEDALLDSRTSDNQFVLNPPHIRFYAAQPIIDPDGYMIGTLCVHDFKPAKLTADQKQALNLLAQEVMSQILISQKQRQQQPYQDFFQHLTDILCFTNLEGRFTEINPTFVEILGWKKEEIVGKPYADFIHPEDLPRSRKEFNKALKGKHTINLINRFRTKKGNYLWLRWKSTLDPNTHLLYSLVQDISKEKEIEQITKSLFQFQTAILNGTAYSIIATDTHGIITSYNTGATHMLGYTANEILYQQTPELLHDQQEILARTLQVEAEFNVSLSTPLESLVYKTKDGKEDIQEWTYLHKDGTRIPVLLSVTALKDQHNNITGYLYIAKDITQQIANEQELLHAKELAEKNAAEKDIFLTNVSHEIRTPMNAIIGFSEILIDTPLNKEQQEFIKAIKVAGENLMVLINDILDFSKIESGILTLSEKPISIAHLLKNIHKLLSEKAKEKQLGFLLHIEQNIPAWVNSDQARLNQILINIIGNAIKFTDKGQVDIHCSLITEDNQNCIIEFKIKDTGIGIKKEKQKIIFERFTQADEQTSKLYGGTGLGLNITKKLLEIFKGDVSVYSEAGQGAEFIITIPFHKSSQQDLKVEEHHPEQTNLAPYKILLAEDNELNQKLGQNVLQQFGMEVDIAENGLEAIKMFQTKKYDIVFLDLQMPEMDGYDAAVYIRSELKSDVPIIAMTAHTMVGEKEKCLSLGMTEYISKPYRPVDVYQKIKFIENRIRPSSLSESFPVTEVSTVTQTAVPYNLDLVREFCNHDEEEVKQFIVIFIKQAEKDLSTLQDSIHADNEEQTSFLAHRMKSTFATFAFEEGKKLAIQIEKNPNSITSQPVLNKLRKMVEEVVVAFRKEYPE